MGGRALLSSGHEGRALGEGAQSSKAEQEDRFCDDSRMRLRKKQQKGQPLTPGRQDRG